MANTVRNQFGSLKLSEFKLCEVYVSPRFSEYLDFINVLPLLPPDVPLFLLLPVYNFLLLEYRLFLDISKLAIEGLAMLL